jgi:moderate conductance mechanosensitive channel
MSAPPILESRIDLPLTWLMTSGIRIVFIVTSAALLLRTIHLLADRLSPVLTGIPQSIERQKRTQTLSNIARTVATTTLLIVSGMLVLGEIGIDIAPLITAAGIGGLAIGFGAQNLVRDVISGFFLLLEDQIRVGDVVKIGDKAGQVEQITLRIITLRDFDGSVHIIPNGTITGVTNRTKEYAYAVVSVGISHRADVDLALATLTEVGAALPSDPLFALDLLGEIEVLGVEDFSAPRLKLTMRIKTAPAKQWRIARELRRRIKLAFDAQGIKLI